MLTLFALSANAYSPALTPVEHGKPLAASSKWVARERSPSSQSIELLFAVKQTNLDVLHSKLMEVSTPSSPKYGKHLSNAAVHEILTPHPDDVLAVRDHLAAHGVTNISAATPNSDMIRATMTIEKAEAVLGGVKYMKLHHTPTDTVAHRILESYHLPKRVAKAVDFVSPTVHLLAPRVAKTAQPSANSGLTLNTPKALRELYSVGSAVGKASANKQAVTAFLGQYYSQSALESFWSTYCDTQNLVCGQGLPKLVGDATTGRAGIESMLDIETITGLAGNIESEFWGFSGRSPDNIENEPFLKWLTEMSSTSDADVPKIFSTSYGEDENSWSKPAAERLNVEFQKAGVRGISLLFASGDEGANCEGSKFVPEGPGSSPYVTAVGGTAPTSGFPSPGSETSIGLSSGGFSDYWAMPSWQTAAVTKYLSTASNLPSAATRGYNVSGRAYPDIAAQATDFCVTPFGCGIAGTSCASPTAAALFSLLNDVRLQAGKSTLGFLNPFIYENSASFYDVTTGSDSGCSFSGGWPAAVGWDASTGFGTPNYEKLSSVVATLP